MGGAWFETFFDEDWLVVALDRDDERTPAEVDFLVARLGLAPGARILDVACGHGRHARELAGRGYRVTGVDLSEPSLEVARREAAGLDAEFVRGDMRELDYDGLFDAAINIYSSFGYFETQEEDERVLAGIARALRPGGRFVLDTVNPPALFTRFRPNDWQDLPGGRTMVTHVDYDVRAGSSVQTWTLIGPDGSRTTKRFSVRLYTAPELEAMLARAGLEVAELNGGFDGAELGRDTFRLIVTAHRV